MSKSALLWLTIVVLGGCASNNGPENDAGGAPGTAGAPASGGRTGSAGAQAAAGSGAAGAAGSPASAGSDSAGSTSAAAGSGVGGSGASAGSNGGIGGTGVAGSSQAGESGMGSAIAGAGAVPHVTPQNATTIPTMYGNTVANPGKLTTHVTYPTYYYSTSLPSALPPPTVAKQSTPMTKYCNVYTPPGYDKGTQYPLIVIMHGITDSPDIWNERSNPNVAKLFDNLITAKDTKPFIAVFASGTINNNTNGYYAFGAELVNDLLPFIEANYSVAKDRGSRAMAGFSFGGMQTINIGLCAHLKYFAWFAGLDAAGGVASSTDIAKYVEAQNPDMYPLYYFYDGVGANDSIAKGDAANAANGLTSKSKYITSANFSYQNNIIGNGSNGGHLYPTAEVSLYNFLRMAFPGN